MEFIENSGVTFKNAVIVSGVTNTDKDEEIIDCLKHYGSIKKTLMVSDQTSSFYKNLIVEFNNAEALNALAPLLPYIHKSEQYSTLEFTVKSLSTEYSATAGVANPAEYIDQLKSMAAKSGQKFEDILKELMGQISGQLEELEEDEEDMDSKDHVQVDKAPPLAGQQGAVSTGGLNAADPAHATPAPSNPLTDQQGRQPRITLSQSDIYTPEVQKLVVEHRWKPDDMSSVNMPAFRLRPFSGKIPKPTNEADYETWRSHIELLLADPNLAPLHITRRILESLLSPAADVVKGLGPNTLPSIYLRVLDSAFATVQDGEELFAQFLNTLQDHGEKPSAYLQRLQLGLNTVVKRGGISFSDFNKHLLKQFCRGCWDNAVINKLQLEQLMSSPPSFAELLLLLRTEEDRQLAKDSLMKKHLTSTKQRAHVHSQSACACGSDNSTILELKQQMQKLQQQMSALLAQKSRPVKPAPPPSKPKPKLNYNANSFRPRPRYCFSCGEDGHMSAGCKNPPNPSLVQQKKRQLEQRQQTWDANNNKTSN